MGHMIYPANFEEKTGFDKIREMLLERCYSPLGEREVRNIECSSSLEHIRCLLNRTEEFRQILLAGKHFPGANYYDPAEVFKQLRPADTFAEPETLLELKWSLETILNIINFLARASEDGKPEYPWLAELTMSLKVDKDLPAQIEALIDDQAIVRSNASQSLAKIRKEQDELEKQALRRINSILNEGKTQGWIKKDAELALRNGRQVIPVVVAFKRKVRGFIHDHSATGQTAFLEPEEVFELNNRIRELAMEERQEIIRLLKAFANVLRPMIPELQQAYDMLGHMDAIRAKASLALDMGATKPQVKDQARLKWVNARHPLLYLAYKKQNKHVEPLTIELNEEDRILVISGPNAGGKSVCLKTCGLLQYMLQCGLLVPMDNYSEAGVFRHLFIDIGDEQSLENDLSTYSSHLLNMKHLLTHANQETLFLIDEFGAGTEPRIGGAIAQAIMEELNAKKAMGVVTTHYTKLKLMAGKRPGMFNGSMLFDSQQMKPLYRLKTGIPGSSFAFEIARSIGLPEVLLEKAGSLSGDRDLDFDIQLQDLEAKKTALEAREKQLRHADDFLSEMIDKYEGLRDQLQDRKNEILLEARREAKQILSGANRMIEKTIRTIKEAQAGKEPTQKARQQLKDFTREQEEELADMPPPSSSAKKAPKKQAKSQDKLDPTPIRVGDMVKVKGQDTPGEVAEITAKKALVIFGSIRLRIGMNELVKLKRSSVVIRAGRKPGGASSFDINARAAAFKPEIDLRGAKVDQALHQLQAHIDDAYLLGVPQIRILHGKGDGILRPAIRNFLQNIPHVHRYRDEHPDRGGAGITIVDFSA